MFCKQCGAQVNAGDNVCSQCGASLNQNYAPPQQVVYNNNYVQNTVSYRSKWVAFILCFFVGVLGFHRFYVGKIGTGILWLFTGGLFGIGWLVDCITILCGSFRDNYGLPLVK